MFNKRLLASITLDKKMLKNRVENSCIIQVIPTTKILCKDEQDELTKCLNRACELLRKSYISCERYNK